MFHWPQVALILLAVFELGFGLASHGKPRTPFHFGALLASWALVLGLIYAGGFWK